MRRPLMFTLAVLSVALCSASAQAQIRLIAITGDLHSGEFHFEYGPDDETLYEINITNAAETRLFQVSRIPDTNTIGYNPNNGLLYHLSGSESYRNTPSTDPDHLGEVRFGFNDNQYMETVNLQTQVMTGVFNANGPPATDAAPVFGLPAPRPDWVLPAERRTAEQEDPSFRQRGEHEYPQAREMAWSTAKNLWYLTADHGIYKLTPDGDSEFVGAPGVEVGDMKGLEFVEVGGVPKLFMGSKETALLYEIDPETGLEIGEGVQVVDALSDPYVRILALATHPETNVLYGIVEPFGDDLQTVRELVTINPTTGATTLIGVLDAPAIPDPNPENPGEMIQPGFASLAFVGFLSSDNDGDGDIDGNDFLLIQRGIGSTHDAGDIAAFKASYGATVGAVASAAAVPEPSALLITAIAIGCLGVGRSRLARRDRS